MASSSGQDDSREAFVCKHCKATNLASQQALDWHQEQSASCRMIRAMAAAANQPVTPPNPVRFDPCQLRAPLGPFYDDLPDLPDNVEDYIRVEDDDDDDDDDGDANGAAPNVGDKRPRFDSARETLLWFNTAGPGRTKVSNRGKDEWLKLMKDERYRLEEVLSQWNSHRDMERTLMKAALGDVSLQSLNESSSKFVPILLLFLCTCTRCEQIKGDSVMMQQSYYIAWVNV